MNLRRLLATLLSTAACLPLPPALAADAAPCWARLAAEAGITQPLGAIQTFQLAGRTFHAPANYLWRGLPRPGLGDQDAVWLLAWLPNLAPSTRETFRQAFEPLAPKVRITLFADGRGLTGQALIDAMMRGKHYDAVEGSLDQLGFRTLRELPYPGGSWAELHLSSDPHHLVHCSVNGTVPNPLCTTVRTIGGPFRIQVEFRKVELPGYAAIDRSVTRMMCCLLDPADTDGQVWPPPNCDIR